MKYRVVFEFQSEDGAMSDVYNYRDEQQAQDKFDELRGEITGAVDPDGCEIIDEPMHYSIIDRQRGLFAYVRLLAE